MSFNLGGHVLVSSPFDAFVSRHGATRRRGVFGMLVHDIGRRIVSGEFAPDALLPNEDDLTARFEVSRTTFREAMKTLASKGMVEIRPKTGTRVRPPEHWHHTDPDVMVWQYETGPSQQFLDALADLRRVLEPAAAARAAERATPQEVEQIAVAYQAMCDAIGDKQAHGEADRHFHEAIFAATHNFMLARMIDLIAIGIYGNTVSAPDAIIAGQRRSLPYHLALLEAIRAGDPGAAADAAERLLDTWHPVAERVRLARRNA
jgi:GntR family galactonate operon transcriptional repressor